MRIIAGSAKGRTLFAPRGGATRPTSDKLRGSIFNILSMRVQGANVLDLFGGTGALALEALSRGAARVVICDVDREAIRSIDRNARNVAGDRFDRDVRVLRADYREAVGLCRGERFDLVFLDPPYRMEEAYADALTRMRAGCVLNDDCLVVMERSSAVCVALPDGFELQSERAYGDTSVDFARFTSRL